jgi:hypothetical protein
MKLFSASLCGKLCVLCVPFFVSLATAQSAFTPEAVKAAASDPLLKAMQQELDRERELLQLPGLQKPYFIEYRLDDFRTYEALANYGALTREEQNHQRIAGTGSRGQRPRSPQVRALDHHRRGLQERAARLRQQAGGPQAFRKTAYRG